MTKRKIDLKIGTRVRDSWLGDWGVGKVVKLLKTRVHIVFKNREGISVYDNQHANLYLKKVGRV